MVVVCDRRLRERRIDLSAVDLRDPRRRDRTAAPRGMGWAQSRVLKRPCSATPSPSSRSTRICSTSSVNGALQKNNRELLESVARIQLGCELQANRAAADYVRVLADRDSLVLEDSADLKMAAESLDVAVERREPDILATLELRHV